MRLPEKKSVTGQSEWNSNVSEFLHPIKRASNVFESHVAGATFAPLFESITLFLRFVSGLFVLLSIICC